MELFPYAMVRIAGRPFDDLRKLDALEAMDLLKDRAARTADLVPLRSRLVDALHEVVGGQDDAELRRLCLAARRDLFNHRQLASSLVEQLLPQVPPALGRDLETWVAVQQEIAELERRGEETLRREMPRLRQAFRELLANEDLGKGLLMSSHVLSEVRDRMLAAEADRPESSRQRRRRMGLLKYVSRMHAKTSPFSTFTSVAFMPFRLQPAGEESDRHRLHLQRSAALRTQVRVNNTIFSYLKSRLVRIPEIYHQLCVRINPTLRCQSGAYDFLTNFHRVDHFQRLPSGGVVDLFLETVTREDTDSFRSVVQAIVDSELVDAEPVEIEAHGLQLIACGLFEFAFSTFALDPEWETALAAELRALPEQPPILGEVTRLLERLHAARRSFCDGGVAERRELLAELDREFLAFQERLDEAARVGEPEAGSASTDGSSSELPTGLLEAIREFPAPPARFPGVRILYEDVVSDGESVGPAEPVRRILTALDRLVHALLPFEKHLRERERMREYFARHHGPGAMVPLTDFYEHYMRYLQQEAEAGSPDGEGSRADWGEAVHGLFAEAARGAKPQIDISLADLEQLAGDREARQPAASRSAMVQFFHGSDGELGAVLSFPCPGFGKMFSRFLYHFDPEVTAAFREENRLSVDPGCLAAEIVDVSSHPANVHPPLMPWEIVAPESRGRLPEDRQIALHDLGVQLDDEQGALRLVHRPSGKDVFVFNLDFEIEGLRSRLFRLCSHFSRSEDVRVVLFLNWINALCFAQLDEQGDSDDGVIRLPRIVLEKRLVLQRRTWLIPRERLPESPAGASDWEIFEHFDRWRRQLGLPAEVFVAVAQKGELPELSEQQRKKLSHDDQKPQYVSFRSPFFTQLLGHLLRKVPRRLIVKEMLPGPSQLLELDGQPVVTEHLVQWSPRR